MRRGALLFLVLLLSACGRGPQGAGPAPSPSPAPLAAAFSLPGPQGQKVEFRPGREGRPTLIEFWSARWNPDNDAALEQLTELHEKYGDDGLRVLAVAFEESPEAVAQIVQTRGLLFETALGTEKVFDAYRLEAIPTVVLVDRQGRVAGRYEGYQDTATLEEAIRKILPGPSGTDPRARELYSLP